MGLLKRWFGTESIASISKFDGVRLKPDRLHVGAILEPSNLDKVTARFSTQGHTLWLDTSGASRGSPHPRCHLVRTSERKLIQYLMTYPDLNSIGLVTVTICAGYKLRRHTQQLARLIALAAAANPDSVWVVLAVGDGAWQDGLLRAVSREGVRLPDSGNDGQ